MAAPTSRALVAKASAESRNNPNLWPLSGGAFRRAASLVSGPPDVETRTYATYRGKNGFQGRCPDNRRYTTRIVGLAVAGLITILAGIYAIDLIALHVP